MFRTSKELMKNSNIPDEDSALTGQQKACTISGVHAVNNESFLTPMQENESEVVLGLGCFWGAERQFWNTPGVIVTCVGYSGGFTPNPTYEEVCSGQTGHAEIVNVRFDTTVTSLDAILKVFWENHDPTQGMRQGNDIGSQYRSLVYTLNKKDESIAEAGKAAFQKALIKAGYAMITTEIDVLSEYYFAEEYHQQYLHKNPYGYCSLGRTGVSCPMDLNI